MGTSIEGEMVGCLEGEGDGYVDLKLKFATPKLVETLKLFEVAGKTIPLTLTGKLKEDFGGTPIKGQDDIRVLKTGKKKGK